MDAEKLLRLMIQCHEDHKDTMCDCPPCKRDRDAWDRDHPELRDDDEFWEKYWEQMRKDTWVQLSPENVRLADEQVGIWGDPLEHGEVCFQYAFGAKCKYGTDLSERLALYGPDSNNPSKYVLYAD